MPRGRGTPHLAGAAAAEPSRAGPARRALCRRRDQAMTQSQRGGGLEFVCAEGACVFLVNRIYHTHAEEPYQPRLAHACS